MESSVSVTDFGLILAINVNGIIDLEYNMKLKVPGRYIAWLFIIWLAAFPYSLMFSEVVLGPLRKEGIREWAKPFYNLFATVPLLTPIGHVLWIVSIAVVFAAPLPLCVLVVLKIMECVRHVVDPRVPNMKL